MTLWLDSADLQQAERWRGIVGGVTTNPGILAKSKLYGWEAISTRLRELCTCFGSQPVSAQVWQLSASHIVENAKRLRDIAPNIVVKVPIVDTEGQPLLWAISKLAEDGICINATACLSPAQAILAADAGARYVSLFCGRLEDEGGNGLEALEIVTGAMEALNARVVAGSIRTVAQVLTYSIVPNVIITVPPDVLHKMTKHARSTETVREFAMEAERIGLT